MSAGISYFKVCNYYTGKGKFQMYEDFFTPGELARLCGISKSLLLYYDRQGILKPACTDSKGFRYYAAKQFFVLENITALRRLDIPLPDIKRFLSYRSTEQLNLLYRKKLKDCHEKIEQYQYYEQQLLENINALSASENLTVNQILLQELPVIDYLAECEISLSQPIKERILTISRFIRPYLQKDYLHKFYYGRFIDPKSFFSQEHSSYHFILLNIFRNTAAIPHKKGLYVTVCCNCNHFRVSSEIKEALQRFIKNNHLTICGPVYMLPTGSHYEVTEWKHMISRICIQVKYKNK